MTTREYAHYLQNLLEIDSYPDISLNGVQIACEEKPLKKVGFAVDACLETLSKAVEEGCDVLVVHHGLFWGSPIAIDGAHYRRVKTAIEGGLMLFACHIPLDCDLTYGNNAQMADALGLVDRGGFAEWKGNVVGVSGRLEKPLGIGEIKEKLGLDEDSTFIDSGRKLFETVGIVSGSGGSDVPEAIEKGFDLFITGEVKHDIYHTALEGGLSVLAGGHYRTETFGVKALLRMTEEKLGVETVFIEAETGL